MPEVVPEEEWQRARDDLLVAEKAARRALDDLAARRRRLPMVSVRTDYEFETPDGRVSFLDLFAGRDQLVVYQFMDNGPEHYCPGCTWFTNNIPANGPAMLAAHGVTWWTVTDMPVRQFGEYAARLGWTMPFASSRGTTFSVDSGAGGGFLLSVFLRSGADVYRTYRTTSRGIDQLTFATGILDLTVYGRREDWEDSPPGWPQLPTYQVPTNMNWGDEATGFGRFG